MPHPFFRKLAADDGSNAAAVQSTGPSRPNRNAEAAGGAGAHERSDLVRDQARLRYSDR
jgi:hypothetical protein